MRRRHTLRVSQILIVLATAVLTSACSWMFPTKPSKAQALAMQRREAVYQETLQSYSADLKPGVSRKEVENYLRAKNTTFQHWRGIHEPEVLADAIRIGKEWHPWYCNEHNVYIFFRFEAVKPRSRSIEAPDDSDVLREITVEHRLEGCIEL
jgi:hypothetical protein